jgi:HEAT repeat protein
MEIIKQLTKHSTRLRLAVGFLVLLCVGAIVLVQTRDAYGSDQDIAKLNRMVQTNRSNAASMKIFQEGRDLIESQSWQKAAERFNDFIKSYPKDKDVDAALYWFGYALQKQGFKEEAKSPLKKLINNHPSSTWRKEAEGMLVLLGEQKAVDEALSRENCEIKVLALPSLFQADPERAITFVSDALKTTSPCPGFQAAAVSLLGSHGKGRVVPLLIEVARSNPDLKVRLTAIRWLGDQHTDQVADELARLYDADRTKEVRSQILRALIESRTARGSAKVLEIARGGDDLNSRLAALRFMGEMEDASTLDELLRMFDNDKTPEVRSQVLRALSQREEPRARTKILDVARNGDSPEIRMEAIRTLGNSGKVAVDDLLLLYSSEANLQIKMALLRALGDTDDARGHSKLFEIARSNDALELRSYAVRQLGGRDDEQTINQLVTMYDSEQNLQVKDALLRAFGDSKQKSAIRKLIAIARSGPTLEQRKRAVNYLGQSKDPEALKFLEELLK